MNRAQHAPPLDQDSGQLSGDLSGGSGGEGRDQRPSSKLTLTKRDAAILDMLVRKVRCIDASLAADAWWPDKSIPKAMRRLRELARAGWLLESKMYSRPFARPTAPLRIWSPGEEAEEFGPLSYFLKNRFTEAASTTSIFSASKQSTKRFGGTSCRVPRRSEVTHDLGLTSVYLTFAAKSPDLCRYWEGESKIVSRGTSRSIKIPDSMLRIPGRGHVAIEFGGEYSKQKLEAFHAFCEQKEMGYELW